MPQLKIVSWNIFGGKNLIQIIELLRDVNADIIGLQEVLQNEGGGNNVANIIADALGYECVYETTALLTATASELLKENGIEKNMEWGNAILSKYPIINNKSYILSESHKRIALEATIKIENKNLYFFSTHLVHTHLQPSEIQVAQIENLLKVVPKKHSIIMGDFNATPESEAIQKMKKVMINTERDTSKFTWSVQSNGCRICGSIGIKYRLDYIFSTKDIRTVSSGTMDSKASDHLLIYSIIEYS